ncbi:MAG: energy transducer TonB [Deltaproteobacteria bacterium]|nr:MAG: energy transducer TonB [Deltaproteobacteria bacterium]
MNSLLLTRLPVDRRLCLALVASACLHLLVLASLHLLRQPVRPSLQAIPIALVPMAGRGDGGDASAGAPEPVAAAPPPPPPVPALPRPRPAPPRPSRPTITARLPAARDEGASVATSPTEQASIGGTGGSTTGGAGEGGGGGAGGALGEARVGYGVNPLPPYPLAARRMGMEGVVLLEVIVAPDGRAREVRVVRSSGHAMLDEAAVSTVRAHWRFIPARRDGVPVESRADVPIRFRLTDDQG